MTTAARVSLTFALSFVAALGCSSKALQEPGNEGSGAEPGGGLPSLRVTLGPAARTFVELASPSVVKARGDGESSIAWDLAFRGRDVFTNGGISGPGSSSAFGPLSAPTFLSDTAPEVPLLLEDRAGGAFIDWYDYGGAAHELFSRYHVYGVKDGDRYFKVQVLGYYGERLGAPLPALYRVRYAEVTETGEEETHELDAIDATAGGSKPDADAQSACLSLDTAELTPLTPAEAAKSKDWHLCFRREAISVNGGLSGPRGVSAVDLQAQLTIEETEAEIQSRTAESEQRAFEQTDWNALSGAEYQEDGAVTAFGRRWLEPGSEPLAVSDAVWLVLGADGARKFLVRFSDLSGDPAEGAAEVTVEAKAVR
ncbi:MAG: hypothetical protein EOO73_20760 [Myxococcales bacterium]|nr:MAG: hypothetical protein EOO73_20760 [Myxococcales bacterium]